MLKHYNQNPINPKRVVIWGASGFVGSALMQFFGRIGIEVLGCSSAELGFGTEAGSYLLKNLREEDVFIMLSAITPDKSRGNSTESFNQNVKMAESVCTVLKKKSCAQVIYFSSDAVYSYGVTPISETTVPQPESSYGEMHLLREKMFQDTIQGPLVIVRSTQIYGASDTHNSYGPCRMLRSALKEGKIFLFNEGAETRDHIFIDDTIQLTNLLLQYRSGGIVNAVTGVSVSFSTLAEKIKNIVESPVEIISIPGNNPVTHRKFDISGLKRNFDQFVCTSLEKGLTKMYQQMCEHAVLNVNG